MSKQKEELIKRQRCEELATRIEVLFPFVAMLVKDIDLFEELFTDSRSRVSMSMTLDPLLRASGIDADEAQLHASIKHRRARALLELVRVFRDTDIEMVEYKRKQEKIAPHAEQLKRMI